MVTTMWKAIVEMKATSPNVDTKIVYLKIIFNLEENGDFQSTKNPDCPLEVNKRKTIYGLVSFERPRSHIHCKHVGKTDFTTEFIV